MIGGKAMEKIVERIPAAKLSKIVHLPESYKGTTVEITVRPCGEGSLQSLKGYASNLNLSLEDLRAERLDV